MVDAVNALGRIDAAAVGNTSDAVIAEVSVVPDVRDNTGDLSAAVDVNAGNNACDTSELLDATAAALEIWADKSSMRKEDCDGESRKIFSGLDGFCMSNSSMEAAAIATSLCS